VAVYGTNIKSHAQAAADLLARAEAKIVEAETRGSLIKTEYKDIRDIVNSAYERLRSGVMDRHVYAGLYENLSDRVHKEAEMPFQVHHFAGFHKKLKVISDWVEGDADTAYVTDILNTMLPILAIWPRVEALKDKVVSLRQVREEAQEAKAKEIIPPATLAAREQVRQALLPIAQAAADDYKARVLSSYKALFQGLKTTIANDGGKAPKNYYGNTTTSWLLLNTFTSVRSMGTLLWTPVDDSTAFERFEAQAFSQAHSVREGFLAKTVGKLAKIVENKLAKVPGGRLDVIVVQKPNVVSGTPEAVLEFTFFDRFMVYVGSFKVKTQVVYASIGRTDYVRYPLTFHDAHHKDDMGCISQMKNLSEAKMVKEF
jgi:hypothetical protein